VFDDLSFVKAEEIVVGDVVAGTEFTFADGEYEVAFSKDHVEFGVLHDEIVFGKVLHSSPKALKAIGHAGVVLEVFRGADVVGSLLALTVQ